MVAEMDMQMVAVMAAWMVVCWDYYTVVYWAVQMDAQTAELRVAMKAGVLVYAMAA